MAAIKNNLYTSIPDWFSKPNNGGSVLSPVPGGASGSGSGYGGGGGFGGNGSGSGGSIRVLKTDDTTSPTDYNVLSSLRSYQDLLRKDKEDSTEFLLSLLGGLITDKIESLNLTQGILGTGFLLQNNYREQEGRSYLEVDELFVRVKALFTELEIRKLSYTGGSIVLTPGGGKCIRVEEYDTFYRCFLKTEEDGETVENTFRVGDQVQCREFNVKVGVNQNAGNRYYWRLCVAAEDDYIDLSKTDCDTNSDAPQAGDDMVMIGNRTNASRQSVIILSTVDSISPSITLYSGINSFSYSDKEYIQMGVDSENYQAFMRVYGNLYVGDRNQDSYLNYTQTNGLVIKGTISTASKYGDSGKTISEAINEAANYYKEDLTSFSQEVIKDLGDLLNQIDGAIETWFYDPVPTLDNLPASGWLTEAELNQHLGDLYYSAEGKAYRFAKNGNTYEWTIITDTDITKALAMASTAQDTADSKRKIFVARPLDTDRYDIGDLWVNATYGEIYKNDVLRANNTKPAGNAFSIDDWGLASKYTDDTAANEAKALADAAQASADEAKNIANNVNDAVYSLRNLTDEVFADGVITRSESLDLERYINNLNSVKGEVEQSYTKVYSNALLVEPFKSNLSTSYTAFITAVDELTTLITQVTTDRVASNEEVAAVDAKYDIFNQKYADYIGYLNAANKDILTTLNNRIDTAFENIGTYSYLKEALKNDTSITGGLIQSSIIALGYNDGTNTIVKAGSSGIYDSSEKGGGIASWWGGPMVDHEAYPNEANYAQGLVRMDGTGYFAGGALWWDLDGEVHADPNSFFVGEDQIANLVTAFKVIVNANKEPIYVQPQLPFQHLSVATNIQLGTENVYIDYESSTNSVYVYKLENGVKKAVNFYAMGEITAYGTSTSGSGSSGLITEVFRFSDLTNGTTFNSDANDTFNAYAIKQIYDLAVNGGAGGSSTLSGLTDVVLSSLANDQVLAYDNGVWVNKTIDTSGGIADGITLWGQPFDGKSSVSGELTGVSKILFTALGENGISYGAYGNPTLGVSSLDWTVYSKDDVALLRVLPSGNVGIGIDSPKYKLDVNGYTRSSGYGIKMDADTSNAKGIQWRNVSQDANIALILYHNTVQNLILNPIGDSSPWNDSSNKYSLIVGNNKLTYNTHTIWHAGNFNPANYLPLSGGTMSGVIKMNEHITNYGTDNNGQVGANTTYGIWMQYGSNYINIKNSNPLVNNTYKIWHDGNAGGPLTYRVHKTATSSSWVAGRENATFCTSSIAGYTPTLSVKTTNGSWEIGAYDANGYKDMLVFSFISDAHYNSYTNTYATQFALASSGVLSLPPSSRIATGEALYIGNSNNAYWLYVQDICSQSGIDKWKIYTSGDATFKTVTATTFTGTLNGTAANADTLDGYHAENFMVFTNETNYVNASFLNSAHSNKATSKYIEFWDSTSGWFNSNWGTVTAKSLVGPLTGNASSATKLQNKRTLWGQDFDGTANVSGALSSVTSIACSGQILASSYKGNYLQGNTTNGSFFGDGNYTMSGMTGAGIYSYGKNPVFFCTDATMRMLIASDGKVGIGTTSPESALHINGGSSGAASVLKITSHGANTYIGAQNTSYCHIYSDLAFYFNQNISAPNIYSRGSLSVTSSITAGGEITAYSDIRLKSNISQLKNRGYIKPVTYIKDGKESIGFIAQDVQKLYPELVIEGKDENKYLSLNYSQYTAVLQSQIIDIDDEVTALKRKVKKLENEIKRLKYGKQ